MDLLAAIAADPVLLPLWAVMLFAAGMYPIGMIFGCTPCCDPCVCASGATLPDTITVTLDGFTDYSKQQLCTLSFSACYGSGGGGTVDAPGQSSPESDPVNDRGPITAVSLTDGGSGYAKLGRAEPTVTAQVTSATGTGAEIELTITKAGPDACGLHYWKVSDATVLNGGDGYTSNPYDDYVTVSFAEGDTEEYPASLGLVVGQGEPEVSLTITSESGSGAQLTPVLGKVSMWWGGFVENGIQSVTIDDAGDGYTHLDTINIVLGEGTQPVASFNAELRLLTANTAPTMTATVAGGTGASLRVVLVEDYDYVGYNDTVPVWLVQSIEVDAPGTGYTQWQQVAITAVDGDSRSPAASAFVSEVDGNGGIVSVYVGSGGKYFKGGPITGIAILSSGDYEKPSGVIEDVILYGGGRYYREDASLPPYVATVTVNINQGNNTPSAGSGAVITATVEDDPQSPDFGKITGLTVANGGNGYLAYVWETNDCCGHYLNGQSIVLERSKEANAGSVLFDVNGQLIYVPASCVYSHRFCGGWRTPFMVGPSWSRSPQNRAMQLSVGFAGEGQPAVAKLALGLGVGDDGGFACGQEWASEENIETCSNFEWSATSESGATISVSPGGTYDPEWRFVGCESTASASCQSCNVCCQGDDDPPEEIEVQWSDEWQPTFMEAWGGLVGGTRPAQSAPDTSGTYVFSKWSATEWRFESTNIGFALGITPGDCGCVGGPLCCEECIRKCAVELMRARIYGWLWYTADFFLTDERYEPYGVPRTKHCETCSDTPMCRPPQGLAIPVRWTRVVVPLPFAHGHAGTLTIQ